MAFEKAGAPAQRVIEALRLAREEKQDEADHIASKIGTDQHHKSLGAAYEKCAEDAQRLAAREEAFEKLFQTGFVT